jgi:hypothetical protein
VHGDTVVACVRVVSGGVAKTEVRTFDTTTPGLVALSAWLAEAGCTHVAMEATGTLRRKAEGAGGVIEINTRQTRLSQFDHTTGEYIKKPLS